MNSRPLPYQDCGSPEKSSKSHDLTLAGTPCVPVVSTDNCAVSVRAGAKEIPGAQAGATGGQKHTERTSGNSDIAELPAYATAFIKSVEDIPPADRLPFLEIAVDCYRAGPPIPPLINYMDEANFWADLAARAELKAYLWACWSHLNAGDQDAFLKHIDDRRAAA